MLKRVLIVAATEEEADALRRIPGMRSSADGFFMGSCEINLLVTGMGSAATSWAMAKWLSANQKPDLAINIGIAGSFREDIKLGEVVIPVSDCFADAGIEDKNVKIEVDNVFVSRAAEKLRSVNALTVNIASGYVAIIEKLLKKFNPDIETMEGATFFYICSREKIPFLALRSISNRVEPRNKKNWDIPLALDNLSETLKEIILSLIEKDETDTGFLSMSQ